MLANSTGLPPMLVRLRLAAFTMRMVPPLLVDTFKATGLEEAFLPPPPPAAASFSWFCWLSTSLGCTIFCPSKLCVTSFALISCWLALALSFVRVWVLLEVRVADLEMAEVVVVVEEAITSFGWEVSVRMLL